jgi:hypothetical protein
MRVAIIGNEEWLVPATNDERRFAVFDVGNGRQKDTKFFHRMRTLMEDGGYRYLLRFLLEWEIDTDVNIAPETRGLLEQKLESLAPFQQWYFESLKNGFFVDSDVNDWPKVIETNRIRDSFRRYCRGRQISSRIITDSAIGKQLQRLAPGIGKSRVRIEGQRVSKYEVPSLEECRKSWEKEVGQYITWD